MAVILISIYFYLPVLPEDDVGVVVGGAVLGLLVIGVCLLTLGYVYRRNHTHTHTRTHNIGTHV